MYLFSPIIFFKGLHNHTSNDSLPKLGWLIWNKNYKMTANNLIFEPIFYFSFFFLPSRSFYHTFLSFLLLYKLNEGEEIFVFHPLFSNHFFPRVFTLFGSFSRKNYSILLIFCCKKLTASRWKII